MGAVLPACVTNGVKIVSNMGAANPLAAARRTAAIARSLGLSGLKIAAVEGDDVITVLRPLGTQPLTENVEGISISWDSVVAANAYLGSGPVLDALRLDADVVITGRVADPSLFVACLRHEYGWGETDWLQLG